jgi:diguanylate cyclase (GGDEF)-like protein
VEKLHIKQKLTVRTALLVFILVVSTTLFRPFFIELDSTFTYIGVAASLFIGANYLYLKNAQPRTWHPYLLFSVMFIILTPLLVMSGGVNSHFISVFPLTPIFLCLIASARAAWILTFGIILMILLLVFFEGAFPNLTIENVSDVKTESRAMWIMLACLVGMVLVAEYDRLNRNANINLIMASSLDPETMTKSNASIKEHLANKIHDAKAQQRWLSLLLLEFEIEDKGARVLSVMNERAKQVARALKLSIRNQNDVIGRYSNSQFLVILEGANQSSAHRIAEKIRQQICDTVFSAESRTNQINITIGYCSLPGDQIHSSEQFLSASEDALNAGKNNGKNCVVGAEQAVINESKLQQRLA